MQIVSDRGMDMTPEQMEGLQIHLVPAMIHLDGKTYISGVDIQPEEFYDLLLSAQGMPTTSLPSPGEFAELYRKLAQTDPEILSVHISSGLSSTYDSAVLGAKLVPEAQVTVYDTLTVSCGEGWQVEAAARAVKAGWPLDKILATLERIHEMTQVVYTLPDLKYLIHGGRISHLKGLLASMLRIKPLLSVSKETGQFDQCGQMRTFKKAVAKLVDMVAEDHAPGTALRVQMMHANNPAGVERLQELLDQRFDCAWLPATSIAPALGAHTGPGLLGVAYASLADYPVLP